MARRNTFLGSVYRLTRRVLIALLLMTALVAGLIGALVVLIAQ